MPEIVVTAELNLAGGIFVLRKSAEWRNTVFISVLDYVKDKLISLKSNISIYTQ